MAAAQLHHHGAGAAATLDELWERLMQPTPHMLFPSSLVASVPVQHSLTCEELDRLLNQMYADICGGFENPFERICRLCRISEHGGGGIVSVLQTAFPHIVLDHCVHAVVAAPISLVDSQQTQASSMHCLFGSNAIHSTFVDLSRRIVVLKHAYIDLDVQFRRDVAENFRVADRIRRCLGRLHDLQHLYVFSCVCYREAVTTCTSESIMQHASIKTLFDTILSSEHSPTRILHERYLEAIAEYDADMETLSPEGVISSNLLDGLDDLFTTVNQLEQRIASKTAAGRGDETASDDSHSECAAAFMRGGDDLESLSSSSASTTHGAKEGGVKRRRSQSLNVPPSKRAVAKMSNSCKEVLHKHFLKMFSHLGLQMRIAITTGGGASHGPSMAVMGGDNGTRYVMVPRFTSKGVFARCYTTIADHKGMPMDIAGDVCLPCAMLTVRNAYRAHAMLTVRTQWLHRSAVAPGGLGEQPHSVQDDAGDDVRCGVGRCDGAGAPGPAVSGAQERPPADLV